MSNRFGSSGRWGKTWVSKRFRVFFTLLQELIRVLPDVTPQHVVCPDGSGIDLQPGSVQGFGDECPPKLTPAVGEPKSK